MNKGHRPKAYHLQCQRRQQIELWWLYLTTFNMANNTTSASLRIYQSKHLMAIFLFSCRNFDIPYNNVDSISS